MRANSHRLILTPQRQIPTPRSPANRANRQSSRSGRSRCRKRRLPKPRRRQPHRPLHHPRRRPPVRFSSRRLPSMPVLVRLLAHSERGADHPLPLLARNVQLRPHCQPRRNCLRLVHSLSSFFVPCNRLQRTLTRSMVQEIRLWQRALRILLNELIDFQPDGKIDLKSEISETLAEFIV